MIEPDNRNVYACEHILVIFHMNAAATSLVKDNWTNMYMRSHAFTTGKL